MARAGLYWIGISVVLGATISVVSVRVLGHKPRRTIALDVAQGTLIGAGLAFVTFLFILPDFYVTKVNGWTTVFGCGEPGAGVLFRAVCDVIFPGPVNVPREAMYWTTKVDGTGQELCGAHDDMLRFPPGGVPSNRAFWSPTMGDAKNHFVPNSLNRYNVGDRSHLVRNTNGSVDIYIQSTAPIGADFTVGHWDFLSITLCLTWTLGHPPGW